MYICSFLPRSISEILLIPLFKNKLTPYLNSTSGFFILSFSSSSACDSAPTYIFSELDDQRQIYDIMCIFHDGGYMEAIRLQIYFHFPILWRFTLRNVKAIRTPNFDQISQSKCCWKQTSVILNFYSRFRFWPFYRHQNVILHRPAKFCTK